MTPRQKQVREATDAAIERAVLEAEASTVPELVEHAIKSAIDALIVELLPPTSAAPHAPDRGNVNADYVVTESNGRGGWRRATTEIDARDAPFSLTVVDGRVRLTSTRPFAIWLSGAKGQPQSIELGEFDDAAEIMAAFLAEHDFGERPNAIAKEGA